MKTATHRLLLPGFVALAALAAGCSDDDTLIVNGAPAADGTEVTLDPSFGTGGRFVVEEASSSEGAAVLYVSGAETPSRIFVAGSTLDGVGVRCLAVWCFRDTGFPDITFGTQGSFVLPTGASPLVVSGSAGTCLAAEADGSIIVGGTGISASGERDAIAIKLGLAGNLELLAWTNAGATGPVGRVDLGLARDETAAAIAVQGVRIYLAGSSRQAGAPPGPGFDSAPGAAFVACFENQLGNRALVPTYGQLGIASTAAPSDRASALVVDGDAAATLAGTRGGGLALFRFSSNGVPVVAFGTAGVAALPAPSGGSDNGTAIARRDDGSLGVAGTRVTAGAPAIAAWRFDGAGRLVGGFGSGGVAVIQVPSGDSSASGVLLDPEGRMLIAGEGRGSFPSGFADPSQALLLRLGSDGKLDEGFTAGGIFALDTPRSGRRSRAAGLVFSEQFPAGVTAVLAGSESLDGGDSHPIAWRVDLPGTSMPPAPPIPQ